MAAARTLSSVCSGAGDARLCRNGFDDGVDGGFVDGVAGGSKICTLRRGAGDGEEEEEEEDEAGFGGGEDASEERRDRVRTIVHNVRNSSETGKALSVAFRLAARRRVSVARASMLRLGVRAGRILGGPPATRRLVRRVSAAALERLAAMRVRYDELCEEATVSVLAPSGARELSELGDVLACLEAWEAARAELRSLEDLEEELEGGTDEGDAELLDEARSERAALLPRVEELGGDLRARLLPRDETEKAPALLGAGVTSAAPNGPRSVSLGQGDPDAEPGDSELELVVHGHGH